MPPRGPRSVLCVVVVTKSACGTGTRVLAAGDQAGDVRQCQTMQRRADALGHRAHAREVERRG